ncbi:MAG: hypothetical protein BWY84_01098 [Candidatus Aerophobetes bacterium ADurb.Bin490]|nr:MAG: hypothetical protein BWY84_01098 [Candidatus Aerophobetes bacterium ADurb.Bin490]HPI02288.1 hypothetical protein [Candidatus Goldiibacteriota bacterium]HPN63583.1 hypothetical protein [Candidatus Goldiibacteriota bacterium]HRQ42730.1 hypothetical protein [Candidatus Goldiibacteriota bacterium]
MKKIILLCVFIIPFAVFLYGQDSASGDKIMVLIENIEKTPAAAAAVPSATAMPQQAKEIKTTRELLDRVLEEKMIDEREALTIKRINEVEKKSAATDLILGVMIMINLLFLVYVMARLNGRQK